MTGGVSFFPQPVPSTPADTIWQITGTHDNQGVTIKASRIHGGAVFSLVWAGTEFIDATDNGRELQTAWTLNTPGETENPTEGGASADGTPATHSTTVVLEANATSNVIRTQAQLAYWLPFQGQTLSPHKLSKTVTLSYNGLTNVIHHQITITIVGDQQAINVEGLTSYSPTAFTQFFTAAGEISPPQGMVYNQPNPAIIANADLTRALALYGKPLYHYGFVTVPKLVCAAYQAGPTSAGDYSWDAYTIFGTPEQVLASLIQLRATA